MESNEDLGRKVILESEISGVNEVREELENLHRILTGVSGFCQCLGTARVNPYPPEDITVTVCSSSSLFLRRQVRL